MKLVLRNEWGTVDNALSGLVLGAFRSRLLRLVRIEVTPRSFEEVSLRLEQVEGPTIVMVFDNSYSSDWDSDLFQRLKQRFKRWSLLNPLLTPNTTITFVSPFPPSPNPY